MKQGEVKLKLGPDEIILRPTPHALRTVLNDFGGVRPLYGKLYNIEYEAVFGIIKAGAVNENGDPMSNDKALEENIYLAGISDLVEPCTEYLELLINGGRPPKKVEDVDTEKKE